MQLRPVDHPGDRIGNLAAGHAGQGERHHRLDVVSAAPLVVLTLRLLIMGLGDLRDRPRPQRVISEERLTLRTGESEDLRRGAIGDGSAWVCPQPPCAWLMLSAATSLRLYLVMVKPFCWWWVRKSALVRSGDDGTA